MNILLWICGVSSIIVIGYSYFAIKAAHGYDVQMASSLKVILRWCAMPIAAITGAFISYALVALWIKGNNYGFELYNGFEVGSITQIILAIAAQAVFGAGFVYCGVLVAPRHNKICAIVLASVFCTLVTIIYVYSVLINGFTFISLIHGVATNVGAIMTASTFQSEKNGSRRAPVESE